VRSQLNAKTLDAIWFSQGEICVAGWRRKALELLPERARMLKSSGGVHAVFAELLHDLERTYRQPVPDRAFIDRVYRFAAWCFAPRQNAYLRNAVAVSFYEHLPAFGPARSDLAREFTPAMWTELQPLLYQMLPPGDYEAFAAEIRALGHDRKTQASSRGI
jgi:hypothetical protein